MLSCLPLPLQVKVDLELMEMKGYSILPQISISEASPSDAVQCYTLDIPLLERCGLTLLQGIQSVYFKSH